MSDHGCVDIVKSPGYSKNVSDIEYIKVQSCFFSEWFGWADGSWDSQACEFFYGIFPLCMAWFIALISKVEEGPAPEEACETILENEKMNWNFYYIYFYIFSI